jgi:hypothetical protein
MGIAGGEVTICFREARIFLDCEEQFRDGFIEAPSDEMRGAYYEERREQAGAGTKAPRDFGVPDPDFGLSRPRPENAADVPAPREIRVEGEGTVNQRHHRADILAEIRQRFCGIRQDPGAVAGNFQSSPREIGAFQTIRIAIVAPIVKKQPKTAERGPGECRPVMRIARDLLL